MRLLITALACLFSFTSSSYVKAQVLGDFYNSSNHHKSKGLNFKIKKPLGFDQKEADRPNIVQKWVESSAQNGVHDYLEFQVLVYHQPPELKGASKDDWEYYLKFDNGISDWTSDIPNVKNTKYFVIDGYPGIYYEYSNTSSRLDMTITMYGMSCVAFLENHSMGLNILSPNKELIEDSKYLFYSLSNSVVFLDQWK